MYLTLDLWKLATFLKEMLDGLSEEDALTCITFRSCFNHPYALICNFFLEGEYCIGKVVNLKIKSYCLVSAAERVSEDGFEIWMNKV